MSLAKEIESRLVTAFSPEVVEVIDESEGHRGHSGYQEGGESHWRVRIKAPVFGAMTRLAHHRAVHDAIGADIMGRIHALALEID